MSVQVGKRNEGKLLVLSKANELAEYTIKICKNEKLFPKSQRWILSKPITEAVIRVVTNIQSANRIRINENGTFVEDDYRLRHRYQMEADAELAKLFCLIKLSRSTFGIQENKIEYWTKLAYETGEKLRAWIKSDVERYKKSINSPKD